IADGQIGPEEAVRAYHGVLQKLKIRPHRPLEKDMEMQTNVMNYSGNGKTVSVPEKREAKAGCACECNGHAKKTNGQPDFSKMTAAEKVAWNRARWDRILG